MPPQTVEVYGPPTQAQSRELDRQARNAYQGETPAPKVRYRIEGGDFAILMIFAGFFDVISLLPIANSVIDPIAQLIIGGIFVINGVSLLERKFLVRYILVWIIEFIPFLSMLPMFLAEAYMLSSLSWAADKALAATTKATTRVAGARAGAMVGLAYGRMITGQIPLPEQIATQVSQTPEKESENGRAYGGTIRPPVDGFRPPPPPANTNKKEKERLIA